MNARRVVTVRDYRRSILILLMLLLGQSLYASPCRKASQFGLWDLATKFSEGTTKP
jgi:hypothetical protein